MLNRVLTWGVVGGIAAGAAITAVHLVWTVPLITDAEVYEHFNGQLPAGGFEAAKAAAVAGHGHDHSPLSRNLLTFVANMLFGVGAGLVFAGLFNLLRLKGLRLGLIWGGAAFLAVSLAPALGLPPELPGASAADLGMRQAWYIGTVAATAIALAVAAYYRSTPAIIAALVLAAIPHLIGAPQPAAHESVVPAELAQEFVVASLSSLAAFWMVLGGVVGVLSERLGVAENTPAHAGSPA